MRFMLHTLIRIALTLLLGVSGCRAAITTAPTQVVPSPTLPPPQRIAFKALSADNRQFEGTYTVNADGTDLKLLSRNGDQIDWSPTGEHVALRYLAVDREEIWILEKDGTNPRRATPPELTGLQSTPRWSPNGKQLAFVYGGPFPTRLQAKEAIYILDVEQGTVIPIPCLPFANCTDPHWSPDGKQIVYTVKQDPVPGHPIDIYIADVTEGSEPRLLREKADNPVWQPHGNQIAFGQEHDRKKDLLVMDSNGANVRTLVKDGAWQLAWSPDGMHIAFAGILQPGKGADICIINVDGSGLHCLENPTTSDTAPVWSPDGRQIAFVGNREGHQEIYVMNVAGTNIRRLIDSPFHQIAPVWSPR